MNTPTASLLKQLEEKVNSGGAFLVSRAELLSLIARIRELETGIDSLRSFAQSRSYGIPPALTYDERREADYAKGYFSALAQLTVELDHISAALSPKPADGGEGEK
jgi:hypothetical protein